MTNYRKDKKPDSLKDILSGLTKKIGLDRKMRESVFLSSWFDIVGFRFKNTTKAVMLKQNGNITTLIVAVKSPIFSQELFLFKKDLLKKAETYSTPLNLKIDDIYFDAKLWSRCNEDSLFSQKESDITYLKEPKEKDLINIEVPSSILYDIDNSVNQANFADENLKIRMKKMMLKDVKAQIWKKEHNYPTCEKCGITMNYITEDKITLCPSCKYND